MLRFTRRLCACALTVALAATACSSEPDSAAPTSSIPPVPHDDPRGSIVDTAAYRTDDPTLLESGARLRSVTYRSTSGVDGSPTEVSGVVAVPDGTPPPNGWPIISFGHGTTGIRPECGPSLNNRLAGSAEYVGALARQGYVVVISDLEGLGTVRPGSAPHRYLDARTAAYNLVDAARAAHYLVPNTSPNWVAYGVSQGGHAAWAAHDLASSYDGATPLHLVGTVALAPVADLVAYVDAARAGTLTPEQKVVYANLVTSWAASDPSVNLTDYLRVPQSGTAGATCTADATAATVAGASADRTMPSTDEAYRALADYARANSVPLADAAPTTPMQVVYSVGDTTVSPDATLAAMASACAAGDAVTVVAQPGQGHVIDPSPTVQWVADRFSGAEPQSVC